MGASPQYSPFAALFVSHLSTGVSPSILQCQLLGQPLLSLSACRLNTKTADARAASGSFSTTKQVGLAALPAPDCLASGIRHHSALSARRSFAFYISHNVCHINRRVVGSWCRTVLQYSMPHACMGLPAPSTIVPWAELGGFI